MNVMISLKVVEFWTAAEYMYSPNNEIINSIPNNEISCSVLFVCECWYFPALVLISQKVTKLKIALQYLHSY